MKCNFEMVEKDWQPLVMLSALLVRVRFVMCA